MNRIKKIAASTALAFGIVAGVTVVAPLTNASSAEAYTATSCYKKWYAGWRYDTICYYDYNWFEESPWGGYKKDGWYRTGTSYA